MSPAVPTRDVGTTEVLGFVGLVLGLSWLQFVPPILEGRGVLEPWNGLWLALDVLFLFSPIIAALVLVGRPFDVEDVRSFLGRRLRWRVSPGWYLTAFLLIPVLVAGALAVFVLVGEPVPTVETGELLLVVGQVFTLGLLANGIETYGWRGYLQEGLQSTHSALVASLAVGVVWGLWHAPLFLRDDTVQSAIPYGWYLVLLVGLSVVFGWVYNGTSGGVLPVTLMHCMLNASSGPVFLSLIRDGGDVGTFTVLLVVGAWVAVMTIFVRTDAETLTAGVPTNQ